MEYQSPTISRGRDPETDAARALPNKRLKLAVRVD
jgi:hypothetical protein